MTVDTRPPAHEPPLTPLGSSSRSTGGACCSTEHGAPSPSATATPGPTIASTATARTLDADQLGHLRHIVALADQAPGDWAYMGSWDPAQEGDDGYRYQLSAMAQALSLAQYHWTPAYRELYRDAQQKLITKMLRRDVWGYWESSSRGSTVLNPDLEVLAEGWVDPVRRKNIMYSGHLLMMVSLYDMLYRDGRYDEEGSLTFDFQPLWRGFGHEKYVYDHTRLVETIRDEYDRNEGLGCECEPNVIFVQCNQYPMLVFALYDHTHGTSTSAATFATFREAWGSKSALFSDDKRLPVWYMVQQDRMVAPERDDEDAASSAVAWAPLMRVWEPEYVDGLYEGVRNATVVETEGGLLNVDMAALIEQQEGFAADPSIERINPMLLANHKLATMAVFAAETGDRATVDRLLAFADARKGRTWIDGRLFYRRADDVSDDSYMTCTMSHGLIPVARLTPTQGHTEMFGRPWTEAELASPELVGVDHPAVLVSRAFFDPERAVLDVTLLAGRGPVGSTTVGVIRLDPSAEYEVRIDEGRVGSASLRRSEARDEISIELSFDDSLAFSVVRLSA